jgi:tyrosinase
MSIGTRRAFLAAAPIPFVTWFRAFGQTPRGAPLVRHDAYGAAGQTMLVKYQTAVQKMKSAAPGDPVGWIFQWYTHFVNGNTTKAAELARIYPTPGPKKALAQEMWNTCQAHSGGDENNFLPWHRMFVYFFERIARKASGDPAFTLPYWNYSASGPNHGRIPPPFRKSGSSLFQANRNSGVNTGGPIDGSPPNGDLSLSALSEPTYVPSGGRQGFCMNLDANLHGNVHVDVGGSKNMGSVPYAANDPVFWLHHCNIDRLWASWNKNGGKNPTNLTDWLKTTFVFVDENGNRVAAAIKDFLDIAGLGYTYEAFEPAPLRFNPAAINAVITEAPQAVHRLRALTLRPVGDSLHNLEAVNPRPATGGQFSNLVKSLPAIGRLYLRLAGLSARTQPGVGYEVFLNMPEGTKGSARAAYQVGQVNFFDAVSHEGHSGSPKFFVFDITDVAKKIAAGGAAVAAPVVTISARGEADKQSSPAIGEVSVFAG